jgi:hypothetical protein
MTTAVLAFARGKVLHAFSIQPAAAILSMCILASGALAGVVAVSGLIPRLVWKTWSMVWPRGVMVAALLIILVVWVMELLAIWVGG